MRIGLFRRGLGAWRTFRQTRRQLVGGTAKLTRAVTAIEARLATTDAAAARLQQAQANLQRSLAEARVLAAAFAEVRATVGRFTGFVPR